MSLRRIAGVQNENAQAKVYYNPEFEEYVVKFYVFVQNIWQHLEAADYFTTDKQDALGTAQEIFTREIYVPKEWHNIS